MIAESVLHAELPQQPPEAVPGGHKTGPSPYVGKVPQ